MNGDKFKIFYISKISKKNTLVITQNSFSMLKNVFFILIEKNPLDIITNTYNIFLTIYNTFLLLIIETKNLGETLKYPIYREFIL